MAEEGVMGIAEPQERQRASVLANRRFLVLWLAQLCSQIGQNAILFTLLVLVLNKTNSSTDTSILVLSYVVPSVLFGMVAGVLVDRWRKRSVLIATNAVRCGAAIAFLLGSDHVWSLYVINLGFSTVSQFFMTAEVSAVPFVVPRRQLIAANSLVSLAWTASQFAGMVFLAPIFLKTYGSNALFIATAVLFLVAAVLTRLLPQIEKDGDLGVSQQETFLKAAPAELRQALRLLHADRASGLAMVQLTLSSSLVLLFAVLVPRFMLEVLRIRADDAVYVFAPTGIGAVLGLRLLPWLAGKVGKDRLVALGLTGIAVCLVGMGFVESIADLLGRTESLNPFGPERLGGLSLLVALAMLFAGPLGLSYAMVNAPAQTVLHERAPPEMRGRVFGAQLALASLVAIIPLLLVGAVVDLYGVSIVLLSIAAVVAVAAAVSVLLTRSGEGLVVEGQGVVLVDAPVLTRLGNKRPRDAGAGSIDSKRGVR
jgi:MFS family permease